MWKWWVGVLVLNAAVSLAAVPSHAKAGSKSVNRKTSSAKQPAEPVAVKPAKLPPPIAGAQITPELRALLLSDYELDVVVKPHHGDAWSRLAKRVTGDGDKWHELAKFNVAGDVLTSDQSVRVPFALLRPELQRQIVMTLFPGDRAIDGGWSHAVVGSSGIEGESLWNIAQWFTGDGANYTAIRKANPAQGISTHKGDVILVPRPLLTAAFAGVEAQRAPRAGSGRTTPHAEPESQHATEKAATVRTPEVRKPEDDPAEHAATDAKPAETTAALEIQPAGGPSPLTYERQAPQPYAVYRLQKGEALYSSVAIRFTGRVYSKDVGDVLDHLVKFNGIENVSRIPVGYHVKIPMELLLPEYLPADDPTRLAQETAKRESAQLARHTRAKGLSGVHVILDAGHGGRDSGATQGGIWESTYVYDVACRLKTILEKRSAADVAMTTKSRDQGYDVPEDDTLAERTDHLVLTQPAYVLDDAVVGVHLRWYLANSLFAKSMKSGAQREKVIFISFHADSLHPSLRGAMAYIPGEKYVQGSFQKSEQIYLTRAEVRERPVVTHSEKESLVAEGLSRDLAESIVDSFESSGLQVHPFNPIRDNVVRDGREWVPAVIRYNLVPTRLLLEICNLGNEKDRTLLTTKKYRQQVAQAVYQGIVDFFDDHQEESGPVTVRAAAR